MEAADVIHDVCLWETLKHPCQSQERDQFGVRRCSVNRKKRESTSNSTTDEAYQLLSVSWERETQPGKHAYSRRFACRPYTDWTADSHKPWAPSQCVAVYRPTDASVPPTPHNMSSITIMQCTDSTAYSPAGSILIARFCRIIVCRKTQCENFCRRQHRGLGKHYWFYRQHNTVAPLSTTLACPDQFSLLAPTLCSRILRGKFSSRVHNFTRRLSSVQNTVPCCIVYGRTYM